MDNTLLKRLAQYGKFTIEASALKLESAWYPHYTIVGQQTGQNSAEPVSHAGYASGEAAVDIAVQRAMFDLDFGASLPA